MDLEKMMARLDHLRDLLAVVVESRNGASEAGSYQGLSALVRQELALLDEVAQLEERIGAMEGELSLEEQVAEWRQVVGTLPDQVIDVFADEYRRRYGVHLRLVSEA